MRLITTILSLILALTASATPTAAEVMKKVSDKLTTPASNTISFTVKSSDGRLPGNMTMSRKLFTFSSGNFAVWYDGRTQWTLNRSAKEVNITTPTAEELIESNPFYIISEHSKHYTPKLLTSSKGQYRIELTAKSKSSTVRKATITVNAKTYKPVSINVVTANGTMYITINSISSGKALPKSYFTFNTKMNKDIEVIDLR